MSRFEHQSAAVIPHESIDDWRASDFDRGKTLYPKEIWCSFAYYQDLYSAQAR